MQKGGLDLTETELKSLTSAMKKPEFRTLLNEYLEEISDPKNKAEYDAYLEQLESSGELPPGRVLIKPQAHSCIKTHGKGEGTRDFKIFLNLCMTDKLPKPTQERAAGGSTWSLPYAIGHPRHDQDGAGKPCITFDCAFNTYAFQLADSSSKFRQLMCETAISGANQLLKKQGEKASSDFKLLKNKRCKGGTPGAIVAAQSSIDNPERAPKPSGERTYNLSEEGPKLYREMMANQMSGRPSEPLIAEPDEEEKEEIQVEEALTGGVKAPKYKLIHSSPIGYADCIETREKAYQRPTILKVEMQVPLLDKLADASIDLQPTLLLFSLKDIYYLELKLPYEVEEAKATAKFDRKKKLLTVTLPTLAVKDMVRPISSTKQDDVEVRQESQSGATQISCDLPELKEGGHGTEKAESRQAEVIDEIKLEEAQPLWTQLSEDKVPTELIQDEAQVLTEVKYRYEEERPVEAPHIEELSSTEAQPVQDTISSPSVESLELLEDIFPEFTFTQHKGTKQAFIVFHVPGLLKASVSQRIYSEEVEIKFSSKVSNRLTGFTFRLRFHKPIDTASSSVDKIIDYVSLKFMKQSDEDWPNAGCAIQEITSTSPLVESVAEESTSEPIVAKQVTKTSIRLKCPLIFDLF